MNNRCWECGKELPKEQKNQNLLCDECKIMESENINHIPDLGGNL